MIAKMEAPTPTASRAAQDCLETTGAIDDVASVRTRQLATDALDRMLGGAAPTAATADVSPPTGRATQLTLTSEVVARMVVGGRGDPTTFTQND